MQPNVHDALESQWDDYDVVGRLHAVPPHEVYEVRVGGQRAVCKVDSGPTGSAGVEGPVLSFVGEQTSVPVPAILSVGDDYYVAAWHPDAPAPDEEQPADAEWAHAAGRALATLHDETAPAIASYGRFEPSNGESRVSAVGADDWHDAATDYLRRRRAVLEQYGHAAVAAAVLEFLEDRPQVFDGAGEPVCCHGWATPAHVSVVDGRVACVVDFEHAIAAPGEFDYWRTVAPTFEREGGRPSGEQTIGGTEGGSGGGSPPDDRRAAFRAGYESVRSLPAGFERRRPLYELLNRVYYLESLFVQDQHGPETTAERAEWLRESVADLLDQLE